MITNLIREKKSNILQTYWKNTSDGMEICWFHVKQPQIIFQLDKTPVYDTKYIEFLYCCHASCMVFLWNGQQFCLEAGNVLLLSEKHLISQIVFSVSFQGYAVCIHPEYANKYWRTINKHFNNDFFNWEWLQKQLQALGYMVIRGHLWLCAVFHTLEELPIQQKLDYCVWKTIELVYLLSIQLLPYENIQNINGTYQEQYRIQIIRNIHDYMVQNLEQTMTISFLAEKFKISATTLKTYFRQLYGSPIHRWLKQQRILYAAHLLETSDLSLLDIAAAVGYSSASQFRKVFQEYYQITPTQYRISMHQKNV